MQSAVSTNQLTPRQLQLLKQIHSFQMSRCYSPTIAELASELSISRSTAFEHITELRKKNLLKTCPGKARSLKLTCQAQKLLDYITDNNLDSSNQPASSIPLLGKVAAGAPLEAIENPEQLSLVSHFGTGDDLFALEVTGDSMTGDDINSGDYVICRRRAVAGNGQLVVAIVDENDATLKRFYKEKKQVRLQPANDNFNPIYSDNCRIEAVVVGLIRKL